MNSLNVATTNYIDLIVIDSALNRNTELTVNINIILLVFKYFCSILLAYPNCNFIVLIL
jgi:hypothetical protein